MTDHEQMIFCGTIFAAASMLRIFGRIQEDYFVWFDPMAGKRWKTPPAQDKKQILVNACQSLQDYLSCNPAKTT